MSLIIVILGFSCLLFQSTDGKRVPGEFPFENEVRQPKLRHLIKFILILILILKSLLTSPSVISNYKLRKLNTVLPNVRLLNSNKILLYN